MELGHPQVALTDALVDAVGHRLPDIVYEWQTPMDRRAGKVPEMKTRRPDMRDIEVRMFPETWASTALGFGGIGGAAMTPAYTVVVFCRGAAAVYWGGSFAYALEPTQAFMNDVYRGHTEPRSKVGKYLPQRTEP